MNVRNLLDTKLKVQKRVNGSYKHIFEEIKVVSWKVEKKNSTIIKERKSDSIEFR